jgi:hypothetical protein
MIGRFLSVDPVSAYSNPVGAFNRYDYAANNPYRFTDPDGRKKIESRITKDWSSLGAHSSNGLMAPNQLSKADRSPRNSQSPKSNSSSASNSCATEERDNDNSEGVEGAENVSRLLELLNAIFGGDAAPAADTAGRFGGTVASFGMAALRTQSRDGTIAFGTMHNLLACESGGGTCEYTRDLPVINSYLRESPPNLIEINSFFEQHDWTYLSIGGLLQWQKDHPGP